MPQTPTSSVWKASCFTATSEHLWIWAPGNVGPPRSPSLYFDRQNTKAWGCGRLGIGAVGVGGRGQASESDPRVWGKNPHLLGELSLPSWTSASSDRAGWVESPTLLGGPGQDTVPLWAPELGERDDSTLRVGGCTGHSKRLATAGPPAHP